MTIPSLFNDDAYLQKVTEQVSRLASQGLVVAVDPDVADLMGAFEDNAIPTAEALESIQDADANGIVITADDQEESNAGGEQ